MVTGHGAEDAGIGFQPGLGAGHHGAADARPEGTSTTAPIDRVRPAPQRCGSCRPRTPPTSSTNSPRRAAAATWPGRRTRRHQRRAARTSAGTSSDTPATRIASCTPSSRGSASAMRTLRPASARTAWACSTPRRRHRHAAAFPAGMPPATYPRPAVPPAHCPRWRRPGERPRPAPAAPPSEPCRCPGESARPAARPRSWNLAGREPRQNMPRSARQLPEGAIQAGSAPAPAASTVRSLTGPVPLRIPGGLGVDRRSRAVGGWLWVGRVTWTVEGRPEFPTVRGTT